MVVQDDGGVRALRSLRTMHLGPHAMLVVISVDFAPGLDGAAIRRRGSRRSLRALLGYTLTATDGSVGHIRDVLFGDRTWVGRSVHVDLSRAALSKAA